MSHMLSVPPWCRLPLVIRWLKQEYEVPFPPQKQPPIHMPIAYGLVDIQSPTVSAGSSSDSGGSRSGTIEDEDSGEGTVGSDMENRKEHPECGICCKATKVCVIVSA